VPTSGPLKEAWRNYSSADGLVKYFFWYCTISSITLLGQTRIGIMICLAHQERVDEVIVVVVAMGKTLPQMQLVVARLVGYPGRVRGGLVPPT